LLLSLGGLALVFIGLAFSMRYIINLVQGPAEIDRPTLLSVTDASAVDRYYVTITGDDTADTGFSYVTTSESGSESTDSYYLALLIDERILLVESNNPEIDLTVTGTLENIPSDIQSEVIDALELEVPEIDGLFLPVLLDDSNFASRGYLGFAVAGIVGLISLAGVGLAGFRLASPSAHRAVKALSRFGEPETVMREIDIEMAMNPVKVGGKTNFTTHWMVSTKNGLIALPYRDAMWCYKQVTQHRTNGVPTGKTYTATIYDRHGKQLTLGGNEAEVEEILNRLTSHAIGIVSGYSDDLNTLWVKERDRFISAVEERRTGGTP
jgi:hypothetical protein